MSSCCAPQGYDPKDVNGSCPNCGGDTVNGEAVEVCSYSPLDCSICGSQPCDLSC